MRSVQAVDNATYWFSKVLLAVSALSAIVMAVHVSADVVARTLLSQPIAGTTEIVSFYYMVAVVCLPLAYLDLRDDHITVDLLYLTMPMWLKRGVFALSCLATAAFFALFAYESWFIALRSMESGEMVMGSASIQIWPSRFFLPIGFVVLTLAALLRAVRGFIVPGDPADPPPERATEDPA